MGMIIGYLNANEREIIIALEIVLIILAVAGIMIAAGINRKLKQITKQVSTYLDSIIESEIEEKDKKQKEDQSCIITSVLEEIFP